MRDYAKISPTIWTGDTGRKLRAKGPEPLVVALYLMSAPGSNMLGVYYQPVLYMAHETGLGIEGASKGLEVCITEGFCHFDMPTEIVWVVEMASYQIAKALKATDKRCAGIQREYDGLPFNPFLGAFFDHYKRAFHMTSRRPLVPPKPGFSEGASEPLPSQEQAQAQAQEQEHEQAQEQAPRARAYARAGPSKPRLAGAAAAAPPSLADEVCLALNQAGIANAKAGSVKLLALLDAGATVDEFVGLADAAKAKDKPIEWLLESLIRKREDAAKRANGMHHGAMPRTETVFERSRRERVAEMHPLIAKKAPGQASNEAKEIVDVDAAKRLG
jgi:hypothetical protein